MHGRFHKTGPHKEFAVYSDISCQSNKMEKHCEITDAENMHRVTCSVFKKTQRLHSN